MNRPDHLKGNMSKDALEEAAAMDGSKRSPNMRPKDASTLIILDGKGTNPKVLMGRRHEGHKFMPGLFVFPGGKVDRHDGSVQAETELQNAETAVAHGEVAPRIQRVIVCLTHHDAR